MSNMIDEFEIFLDESVLLIRLFYLHISCAAALFIFIVRFILYMYIVQSDIGVHLKLISVIQINSILF